MRARVCEKGMAGSQRDTCMLFDRNLEVRFCLPFARPGKVFYKTLVLFI